MLGWWRPGQTVWSRVWLVPRFPRTLQLDLPYPVLMSVFSPFRILINPWYHLNRYARISHNSLYPALLQTMCVWWQVTSPGQDAESSRRRALVVPLRDCFNQVDWDENFRELVTLSSGLGILDWVNQLSPFASHSLLFWCGRGGSSHFKFLLPQLPHCDGQGAEITLFFLRLLYGGGRRTLRHRSFRASCF